MSIEHLLVEQTGLQRPEYKPVEATLTINDTGNSSPAGLATQFEFVARLAVETRFWANRAQKRDASERAYKVLLAKMNGELLADIAVLESAVASGDRDLALMQCSKLRKGIGGE